MLITRETDYALRILRFLSDGQQATVGEIAEEELLPQQFAYKIIKKLSRAGLICITRGSEGGCRLEADLRKVTLYDLLEAMESDRLVSACMEPGYHCAWRERNHKDCTVHKQLSLIQTALDRELKEHSLQKIISGAV